MPGIPLSPISADALDLLLIAIVLVAGPAAGALYFVPRRRALPPEVMHGRRSLFYLRVMALQWLTGSIALWLWLRSGRTWHDLGLGFEPGWGLAVGAGIVAAIVVVLAVNARALLSKPENIELAAAATQKLHWIMPRGTRQRWLWAALCAHAGVHEEILCRGFVIGCLAPWLGAWWACALAVVLFSLGHVYQGLTGVVKTGVAGVIFLALYVLSGSLWLSMLLHALVDLHGGLVVSAVLDRFDAARGAPAADD